MDTEVPPGVRFFSPAPLFCEHRLTVSNGLNLSCFALNHCGYSHVEVCNVPVKYIMGNFFDFSTLSGQY